MTVADLAAAAAGRFDADPRIAHHFLPGIYAKEMHLPKGFTAFSHAHPFDHRSLYIEGRALKQEVSLLAHAIKKELPVEAEFNARAELLLNPMKQIQGGFLCAMLDEVMSIACMVASGMTAVAPTLEMKTTFLRPGAPGPIRGVGRVIKWGRQVAFTEGELYDPEGRMRAKASGTAIPTPFTRYKT